MQSATMTDNEIRQRLIETIWQHPMLYDSTHPDYTNYKERDKVWEDIGTLFNETGLAVKVKWRSIMTMYRKYLKFHTCAENSKDKVAFRKYRNWQWAPYLEPFRQFETKFVNMETVEVNPPLKDSFISIAEFNVSDIMCKQECTAEYFDETDPLDDEPEPDIPEEKYNVGRTPAEPAVVTNNTPNAVTTTPVENGVSAEIVIISPIPSNEVDKVVGTNGLDTSLVMVSRKEDVPASPTKIPPRKKQIARPVMQKKSVKKTLINKKFFKKRKPARRHWDNKKKSTIAKQLLIPEIIKQQDNKSAIVKSVDPNSGTPNSGNPDSGNLKSVNLNSGNLKSVNLKPMTVVIQKLDTKKLNLTTTIKVSKTNTPIINAVDPPPPSPPRAVADNKPPEITPKEVAVESSSTEIAIARETREQPKRNFTSTELIFLGYAKILESMPPDVRVMAKIKIADIMMNEELLQVQKSG